MSEGRAIRRIGIETSSRRRRARSPLNNTVVEYAEARSRTAHISAPFTSATSSRNGAANPKVVRSYRKNVPTASTTYPKRRPNRRRPCSQSASTRVEMSMPAVLPSGCSTVTVVPRILTTSTSIICCVTSPGRRTTRSVRRPDWRHRSRPTAANGTTCREWPIGTAAPSVGPPILLNPS